MWCCFLLVSLKDDEPIIGGAESRDQTHIRKFLSQRHKQLPWKPEVTSDLPCLFQSCLVFVCVHLDLYVAKCKMLPCFVEVLWYYVLWWQTSTDLSIIVKWKEIDVLLSVVCIFFQYHWVGLTFHFNYCTNFSRNSYSSFLNHSIWWQVSQCHVIFVSNLNNVIIVLVVLSGCCFVGDGTSGLVPCLL